MNSFEDAWAGDLAFSVRTLSVSSAGPCPSTQLAEQITQGMQFGFRRCSVCRKGESTASESQSGPSTLRRTRRQLFGLLGNCGFVAAGSRFGTRAQDRNSGLAGARPPYAEFSSSACPCFSDHTVTGSMCIVEQLTTRLHVTQLHQYPTWQGVRPPQAVLILSQAVCGDLAGSSSATRGYTFGTQAQTMRAMRPRTLGACCSSW